jgi:hypothetical protein
MGLLSKCRSIAVKLGAVIVCAASAPLAQAHQKVEFLFSDHGQSVLQCSIALGEFQEVSVYSMSNGTLRMMTIDKAGFVQWYAMPSRQWSIGKLEVPCSNDEKKTCGEVYANGHFWSYQIGSSIGDCL